MISIKVKSIILLLSLSLIISSLLGCNLLTKDSVTPGPGGNNPALWIELSLSKPPKTGETSDLKITAYAHYIPTMLTPESLVNSKIWVEITWANTKGSYSEAEYAVSIPLDEVRVDGDLSWQGAIEVQKPVEILSTIKLPREGVWTITGYFMGEGWEKPLTDQMRVAVTKDAAAVIGTKEFYSGPLAYLGNFGYGQAGKPVLSESQDPVVLELDISKAPQSEEETLLTCHIYSLFDISDFSTQITFWKRTDSKAATKVPGEGLWIDGSLSWTGSLKKNEPTQFSAKIRFPEEGDWQIHVDGNYPTSGKLGFTDDIRMTVSRDQSYFGWKNWP